ncbi:MAG: DUF1570 domain-containing protein [Planctomycetia bacterium]|nr:DUF1570 domain-containing protein [Planctomycetia bacterium]
MLSATAHADPPILTDVSRWPLEQITCRDGRTFGGLIRHEDDQQIELVEVGRRPGKPMFLLVRPIRSSEVKKIVRLSPAERELLGQRIDAFRNRVAVMAELVSDVRLVEHRDSANQNGAAARRWTYEGPWFSLESTADEAVTREATVRIEQTFAAYRTLLRPRREPASAPNAKPVNNKPLKIRLMGTVAEFRAYVAAAGLRIDNPAFYDPRQNLIVAGGDLGSLARRLADARAHHQQLLQELPQLDERFRRLAKDLSQALERNGTDPEKRRQLLAAARAQWQEQRQALMRDIHRAEADNAQLYYRHFSRLYHEAFHAYLENYVFDATHHDLPRWLNEGWAQIFEAGLLESDTLRVDAPRADLLAALTTDVQSKSPLPLATLLSAPAADFLEGHQDATPSGNRLYVYAWGLAYYLTFERQLLGTPAMEEYLSKSKTPRDPTERFEKLVGRPLAEFEVEWRRAMTAARDGSPRSHGGTEK